MMLLLVLDVFNQAVLVGVGRRESAVAFLPALESGEQSLLLNPYTRRDLDVLHEVGEGNGRMHACQNVDMILDGIDAVQMRVFIANDAPGITKEFFAMFLYQNTLTPLRGEDQVVINLCEGRHVGWSRCGARRAQI